ncbi:MAG: sulfide-dependent adenosine diphosphate thiazole synthase [Desulfohalobiaceae bacterium]
MSLEETIVTEAIATEYFRKLHSSLELDVAVIGAGPSGMTAAWRLAAAGCNVAVFERKLSIGGGMWGGGMTWNFIVVQEESRQTLEEAGLSLQEFKPGYYTVDAVAATTTLASKAALAGAKFFTCMSVEDVVLREVKGSKQVTGIVVNSSPVEMAGLHVDPLVLSCKCLLESTGHDLEVLSTLVRKNDVRLDTPSGGLQGEQSMWAEVAEKTTVQNTREIFPGVFVAGMAANAAFGSYRMGPIFGGMLLSGEKAARQILQRLGHEQ